jgi:N-acetyl-gamma-glutamyl-phosphate/LysW-gamma-L-alpha-aminoadipyl-6-phosphate reductase
MSEKIRAGVVGASGYTGGELLRLLVTHPDVELQWATSRRFKGLFLSSIHPSLRGFTNLRFIEFSDVENCDIVFLCLPHKASFDFVKELYGRVKIIDLSADFRIRDIESYRKYYSQHPYPGFLGKAVYGLPEIHRDEIRDAQLVANPGCIATSAILALYPVREIAKNANIVLDVKIGSSAGGRKPTMGNIHAERCGVVRPYSSSGHRHLAEVEQETGLKNVGITCHAIDAVRGIMTTCHVLGSGLPSERELRETYNKAYGNEYFVRIVAKKTGMYNLPDIKTVARTNFCEIGFHVDEHAGRFVVFSALDNMIKGAAGQAIQNMNLMFGLDETTGLKTPGFYI